MPITIAVGESVMNDGTEHTYGFNTVMSVIVLVFLSMWLGTWIYGKLFSTNVFTSMYCWSPFEGKTHVTGAVDVWGSRQRMGVLLAYGSQVHYATTDTDGGFSTYFPSTKAHAAHLLEVFVPNQDGSMRPLSTKLPTATCGNDDDDGDDQ